MYEKEFILVEGKKMTLKELGAEIESIIGKPVVDILGSPDRVVVKKPAPEQGFETFNVTYQVDDSRDFISGVVTTKNKKKLEKYDFENESFKVRLLSYNRRDAE
ncbi:hypothetical protein [Phocicoccus pinnipedialis]|uniref:Uncharacterized protein n=1 Tax=Phocicoccus pinnipedialis TaxID=110845 RepID=A0A6V7R0K7_9BACL|nr:hypothetical protein [Jeotgalicoccus pinnipedialis]MBP1938733.1 hypothetical protein [Jeotgalicoccus pinnipedialis]CAD2070563.1 hypothetical protein JEOPIN946_00043 [Jeotgalicoccus pinnipedialis]